MSSTNTLPTSALPTTFQTAPRIHHALTANLERRILAILARHTPRAINADHLTLLGLFAQLAAGLSYALVRHHRPALLAVNLFIALNWLGDSLDGTLARFRQQQRPRYGFYVDHALDIFGATALMSGLAASGILHPAVGLAMLVAFLLLSAESFLATHTLARFHLSTGPFGPTEIRLLLITGNFFLLRSPYAHLFGHTVLLFDLGGTIATTSMLLTALTLTLRHTAELYRQEPLPTEISTHPEPTTHHER